ncbi:MAG TPA: anthranilate phosphoribosyltransferase [Polyangiaceae bacterium]|nr:anthranilate phosphoribosyltransferase [Polyangiaceae bacterium]
MKLPKFPEVLAELSAPTGLSAETAWHVFDAIFRGDWPATQIAGLLVALHLRGASASVVGAAARAMRANMLPVEHSLPVVLDTCGTGGDGLGTVNISTGAALIVSAAGVPVAKHGNRASSSRAGSADVLAALGVSLDVPPEAQARVLSEANITFLFAPAHHPAMKHAGPPRRELGVRTIFNLLGPLANPARATHQLVGAYSDEARRIMAGALLELGVEAWVVHSEDGLDEISPYAPTRVSAVERGVVRERVVTPHDFGFEPSAPGAIAGGSAEENAQIIRRVLAGEAHPAAPALLLNAAASLALARGSCLLDAAALARATVASGAALRTLATWCESSQRAARATPAQVAS